MKAKPNVQSWLSVAISSGMLLLAFAGAIGSFYKSISVYQQTALDVKQETQKVIASEIKELRNEIKSNYATKEEINFIQNSMSEMKNDVKEIKRSVISSEILSLETKIREQGKKKFGEKEWNRKGDKVMDIIRRKGLKLEKAWRIANEQEKKETKQIDLSFLN